MPRRTSIRSARIHSAASASASSAQTLEVVVDDRLRLLRAPEDDVTYRVGAGRARVDFAWDEAPEGGPYRVTVARDPELDATVERSEVTEAKWSTRLGPGRYYWIVHRVGDPDVPLSVQPRSFRVERTKADLRVPEKLDWSRRRR